MIGPFYQMSGLLSRYELGTYLNSKNLTGTGVEIGTHRGEFAYNLLQNWRGDLVCVDPWDSQPESYTEQAKLLTALGGNGDRLEDFLAFEKTCFYELCSGTCSFIKSTSADLIANKSLRDKYKINELDFVYVDGDHTLSEVIYDLFQWGKLVKKGGVIAGHDIICPNEVDGGWGRNIQYAVQLFCLAHQIQDVFLIQEANGAPWSFYIEL